MVANFKHTHAQSIHLDILGTAKYSGSLGRFVAALENSVLAAIRNLVLYLIRSQGMSVPEARENYRGSCSGHRPRYRAHSLNGPGGPQRRIDRNQKQASTLFVSKAPKVGGNISEWWAD